MRLSRAKLSRTCFFHLSLGGKRFEAHVNRGGPYLGTNDRTDNQSPFGVCAIMELDSGWWVTKYTDERINLSTLTEQEREKLAAEFGIPIAPRGSERPTPNEHERLFFTSPAFAALRQWARQHPTMLRRFQEQTYLPWYERLMTHAVNENG